jgi:hypothetical protein
MENRALSRLTLLFKKYALKLGHIVKHGTLMRKDRFNLCPAPQGGQSQKDWVPIGVQTKAVFLLLPYSIRKQEPVRAAWKETDSDD